MPYVDHNKTVVLTRLDSVLSLVSMAVINIYDAKTQLSRLINRVQRGEEIIIARAGKPVVKLVAVEQGAGRQPGGDKGVLRYDDGLHAPLPDDMTESFYR